MGAEPDTKKKSFAPLRMYARRATTTQIARQPPPRKPLWQAFGV